MVVARAPRTLPTLAGQRPHLRPPNAHHPLGGEHVVDHVLRGIVHGAVQARGHAVRGRDPAQASGGQRLDDPAPTAGEPESLSRRDLLQASLI